MVIRGGENVYPRESRGVPLYAPGHPWTPRRSACRTRSTVKRIMGPGFACARVAEAAHRGLTARVLAPGRLAHYKIPRYVHIVDEFPHDGHRQRSARSRCGRARGVEILGLRLKPTTNRCRVSRRASRRLGHRYWRGFSHSSAEHALTERAVGDRSAHCRSRCHSAVDSVAATAFR